MIGNHRLGKVRSRGVEASLISIPIHSVDLTISSNIGVAPLHHSNISVIHSSHGAHSLGLDTILSLVTVVEGGVDGGRVEHVPDDSNLLGCSLHIRNSGSDGLTWQSSNVGVLSLHHRLWCRDSNVTISWSQVPRVHISGLLNSGSKISSLHSTSFLHLHL